MKKRGLHAASSYRRVCEKEFQKARKASAEAFSWESATFEGIDESKSRVRDAGGLRVVDIHFFVEADGKRHRFELDDCAEVERGWTCTDGIKYRGPE